MVIVGDESVLEGIERSREMVPWAALIAEAGYQVRDEKIHKRGKAALALQDSWFADSEQLPQDAT